MNPQQSADTKGVVGLQNMGNTCYVNSTLQLLRACPDWTVYCMMTDLPTTMERPARVLRAFRDVQQSLWSAYYPGYVRPAGFLHEIQQVVQGTVYDMFGLPMQNDSHEFLVYLLDQFHEAQSEKPAFHELDLPIVDGVVPTERVMQIRAINGWNRYCSTHGTSPIVRLCYGMIRKTIECSHCHNRTYQWEPFNTLKIPCVAGQPFREWIRRELNDCAEIDQYQCNTCHARYPATIQSHLWKLPPHLFLTLRRFQPDGQKDTSPCPYEGGLLSFDSYYAPESDDPMRNVQYELRGVSDHHGTHLGGHYTAQFKHPSTGQWWWFDDERAMPMPQPQCSASNYLFYFRASPSADSPHEQEPSMAVNIMR